MDPRLQKRVQRYGWDKAADHYEKYWRDQLKPAQDKLLELADLQPGEHVLDLACGTGLVTVRAAECVGPTGRVLGTDISQSMVDAARAVTDELELRHVAFERMEAETIAMDEGTFDAVLCGLGLMYVTDPSQSLGEMHRVLRQGGRAVSAVWGQRDRCGWAEIFPIVDSRVQSEVCPMFFQLGSGTVQEMVFEGAGFDSVTTARIETTLFYDTDEDACGAAFAGGPVALAYSRFDENTREEAHAEYLASIKRFHNGNRYEIPGEFVITIGWKK